MEVGDWVKIKGQNGNKDRTGYIFETTDFGRFTVIQTIPWVEYAVAKLTLYRGSFVPLDKDEVDTLGIDAMIDMALKTRDKEWFIELTSRFKNKK